MSPSKNLDKIWVGKRKDKIKLRNNFRKIKGV